MVNPVESLEIEVGLHGTLPACRPVGAVDASTASCLAEALVGLAGEETVLVDLAGTTFMDSAGLGALREGIAVVRDAGTRVLLAGERPSLHRLLHAAGVDRMVEMVSVAQ